MTTYRILFIPTGEFVSTCMIANKPTRDLKQIILFGYNSLNLKSEPVVFPSKTKAKLWLRQHSNRIKKTLYMIIEVEEKNYGG